MRGMRETSLKACTILYGRADSESSGGVLPERSKHWLGLGVGLGFGLGLGLGLGFGFGFGLRLGLG